MEKIKCYTMTDGTTTLYAQDPQIILDHLHVELNESIHEDETKEFTFGVKYLTQEEIDKMGEFDGF